MMPWISPSTRRPGRFQVSDRADSQRTQLIRSLICSSYFVHQLSPLSLVLSLVQWSFDIAASLFLVFRCYFVSKMVSLRGIWVFTWKYVPLDYHVPTNCDDMWQQLVQKSFLSINFSLSEYDLFKWTNAAFALFIYVNTPPRDRVSVNCVTYHCVRAQFWR